MNRTISNISTGLNIFITSGSSYIAAAAAGVSLNSMIQPRVGLFLTLFQRRTEMTLMKILSTREMNVKTNVTVPV